MTKNTKKIGLFLILPLFSIILVGCGNKNLTNGQNGIKNATVKTNLPLTMTEVAQHNSVTDCWQVIAGNVYDLSPYIASGKHPNNKINDGCGQDATAMFNAIAKHKGKAQAMLSEYLLGTLQN